MQYFTDRLKLIQEQKGLSTATISKMLGIHPPTWCKYISGKSGMSMETLYNFCKTFNVSADWLLGLQDDGEGE